jgi:hypothetical protein
MWTNYFNFIKLRRGRVIVPFHGEIDFSRDDIPVEICKELFDKGFPYLELTELGKKEIYPNIPGISGESIQILSSEAMEKSHRITKKERIRKTAIPN